MRNNATSGLPLLICISICTLIMLSIASTVYAKRGCTVYGHSCLGGHGKRFDPDVRDNALPENEAATNDRNQDMRPVRLSNDLAVLDKKFEGKPKILPSQIRQQDSPRLNPYTLSFIVQQWLTSHHRLQQPNVELNIK